MTNFNYLAVGCLKSKSGSWRSRDRRREISARLLLAGAGGVGLQRPDALGQRAAALGATLGEPCVAAPLAGSRRTCRRLALRRQHGLDRRIRPFQLHRQFGHFGGDIVDAFAQQCIFHALGRPGAFGLLLDRVDVALQLGAFVARERGAVPRPRPSRPSVFPAPAMRRCW